MNVFAGSGKLHQEFHLQEETETEIAALTALGEGVARTMAFIQGR